MRENYRHRVSIVSAALFAATLLLTAGPGALRTITELHMLIAQISIEVCEIGLVVLRVCGI